MAYALQDEKVRDAINHDKLLKMLDGGIDDMEAGRELPLTEALEMLGGIFGKRNPCLKSAKRRARLGNIHTQQHDYTY